ncbi:energy-coupling factor transport system ATP-binding protein [Acetitomaculum ruminis DSM 5522]|uniref:Energy-coupling factor transport system ATP-binding protein n=1 Tax=Acetitomaculum ruminis DSM 5522 TaxID=1120918 RepID=A0A1I0X8E7_9FIRM|nr:ABC transporter ATP-binding protein [Acetitomaculum ruminis]SFA97191.1 energy-coupling factor transport system ATP-binding protein [Acetitomaculum ruminis DSM 5522]
MEAIKLENLSFSYNGQNLNNGIHNINLSVKEGECVLLVGTSGCGKSTVLRAINGLAPYFYEGKLEGEVFLMGKSAKKIRFENKSKICGSVFQNPRSQFFYLNTSSEIAFGCENQGLSQKEIEKRVNESIKLFRIDNLADRDILKLSGGEKQKIAFAGIYASRPDIYVLDEPSANLDLDAIKDIKAIIKKIKEEKKTIIIAEHRLYYLMDIVDRILYMDKGEIVEEFTLDEFKKLSSKELRKRGLRAPDYRMLKKEAFNITKKKSDFDEKLILKDITCQYKKSRFKTLNIKECQLPLHEKIAIIGHNGAGKSTFVNGFCGMNKNVKARVYKDGKLIPLRKRVRESFEVFQEVNHQLFTNSVEEEVSLGSEDNTGKNKLELLSSLGLKDFLDTHPMALSGGQKQRVAIASALYSGRRMICLDEPTSGLDYRQMDKVAGLLDTLQSKVDLTMVITHDLELILKTCTYVLHIENGQLVEEYPLDKEGREKLFSFFDYEK